MADENRKNGDEVGVLERVKSGIKDDMQSLKTDLPAKAKEQLDGLKDPTKTQVYTSIFRHKHDDTPRNRALGVLSNVFLHLHPAKINRDSVRYSYTWGMGGITFYLFIAHMCTAAHPFLSRAAFKDTNYVIGLCMSFVGILVAYGTNAILPTMFQSLMGYPALTTGILVMPRGLGMLVSTAITSRLLRTIDPRALILVGLVIIAFMMANIPIGSANSASFGCPAATYRKKGTGKVKKKSTTLPK